MATKRKSTEAWRRILMIASASVVASAASASEGAGDSEGEARSLASEHLAAIIRYATISPGEDAPFDRAPFSALADFLADAYPAFHAIAEREVIGGASLIYRWPATASADAAANRQPIALLAHMDVVPVEPETISAWTHPPFAGVVADGRVWGRGALDDKGSLVAMMEAVERLARDGFAPVRDIYLLFGHDEEVGGRAGAAQIAATLKARGVRLAFTLDEGSGVSDGVIDGATTPVALIAIAEKGYVDLKFTARADGGHSSTPGAQTAVTRVARAVVTVNENPYPLEIDGVVKDFLNGLAPAMPQPQRFALSNLWLTGGFVKGRLAKSPLTAAALRTTTAPTIIRGGVKSNILPQTAEAIVNYRIHPRDNVEAVRDRAARLVNDENVEVEIITGNEPSSVSSVASPGYGAIASTIAPIFGDVPIAPMLTLQGTDSRHYGDVAADRYRFTPFIYEADDLEQIHGTDEAVSIDNLERAVDWYAAFLANAAGRD